MPRSRSTRNTGRPARNSGSALQSHYLAADYIVGGGEEFVLKVGCASRALLALHRRYGVNSSAFLTACNPRSQRRSGEANECAQRQLMSLVGRRGYVAVPGRGVDPAGAWPSEESVLVLGIRAAEACGLARRFGQNALLVMTADTVPRLVWVRSAEPPPG